MKFLLALPLVVLLGAAASPPESDVKTGRSVALEKQQYWLSSDLNRLFLQKSARGSEAPSNDKATR